MIGESVDGALVRLPVARHGKQLSALVCGIAMPIKPDRTSIDRPGGDATHRPHLVPRASPRLEILEPRYLMSGLPEADSYEPVPRPTPIVQSYVIVYETDAPHNSLASAQALPDVPKFGVIGSLDSGDLIDFYRMHIGTGTAGLQFELNATSGQSSPLVPSRFMLFDETGRVLGGWTTGVPQATCPSPSNWTAGPRSRPFISGFRGPRQTGWVELPRPSITNCGSSVRRRPRSQPRSRPPPQPLSNP